MKKLKRKAFIATSSFSILYTKFDVDDRFSVELKIPWHIK